MQGFLATILSLVASGKVRISAHDYDELAEDDILVSELLAGIVGAHVIEAYPNYPKGPCILVLRHDKLGQPVHAVWGIPRGAGSPAVLVTAYRPDPKKWSDDYRQRKQ